MRHIFYIDPLEKLNLKKDSSLLLALRAQERGDEVVVLFEKELAWGNGVTTLKVHRIAGKVENFYLRDVALTQTLEIAPHPGDVIHMRLDPPFDGRYLRYLWLLDQWERKGVRVVNRPRGIMQFNEKLCAYQRPDAVPSWVGEDAAGFQRFCQELTAKGVQEIVLKPLDLYSGIGVEKWELDHPKLHERFRIKAHELQGPIVAQSFMPEVRAGEVRALYFKGEHLGSILKKPKAGEFISNIAQGAAFEAIELSARVQAKCRQICSELTSEGVDWVAFDILGETPTEVNITCPGLLVEVCYAHQKDLAGRILELL